MSGTGAMRTKHLVPSLTGLALSCLCLGGGAYAQGHGTPNAPEAGPASPGTESRTGQGNADSEAGGEHKFDPRSQGSDDRPSDEKRKAGEPKP